MMNKNRKISIIGGFRIYLGLKIVLFQLVPLLFMSIRDAFADEHDSMRFEGIREERLLFHRV